MTIDDDNPTRKELRETSATDPALRILAIPSKPSEYKTKVKTKDDPNMSDSKKRGSLGSALWTTQ